MPHFHLQSPVGTLRLDQRAGALVALDWADGAGDSPAPTPLLREARAQLMAYFDGSLERFDLPLAPAGSPYRQRVWQHMAAIPYGETLTYGALARAITSAPRPVGGACGANPIAIILPCHRVLPSTGGLGGYSGGRGLETKAYLLALERGHRRPARDTAPAAR